MVGQRCKQQNSTRHVIQPLLEETSLLWHHAGDIPELFIQNVKASKERKWSGLEGKEVVTFYLTHAILQPQLSVPGARFSAEFINPMAWDSRCLNLSRPSMNFTASLAPELKKLSAQMVDSGILPWTATNPSIVTWLLPNSATFDSSTKFCIGLQVCTQE